MVFVLIQTKKTRGWEDDEVLTLGSGAIEGDGLFEWDTEWLFALRLDEA